MLISLPRFFVVVIRRRSHCCCCSDFEFFESTGERRIESKENKILSVFSIISYSCVCVRVCVLGRPLMRLYCVVVRRYGKISNLIYSIQAIESAPQPTAKKKYK